MNVQWVRLKSWHALVPYDHHGPATFCGRDAEGLEVRDELPAEKSCESCARILLRRLDVKDD